MISSAVLSNCRTYRYNLWRIWDDDLPVCNFVMLNPSTADESEDDTTIRRCIGYARSWGYGSIIVSNLFALRATDPKDLRVSPDPVGPENDAVLTLCAQESDIVICAWSNHGSIKKRSTAVRGLLEGYPLHYLKMNGTGEPAHPLYLRGDLVPVRWV